MSTQYDTIQAPYDNIRQKSIALIEHENVQELIAPYIQNAHVLELACGSGFYTHSFLKWGASHVVGVDISPIMIAEAQRQGRNSLSSSTPTPLTTTPTNPGTLDFILADCTQPTSYAGGPFDIVFGAWLLNYAPTRSALVAMYRNIALNLKPGGRFISVTVPPAHDPRAFMATELRARPPPLGSGGLYYDIRGEVEDGVAFHVHGETEVGNVDFDCWHLRRGVYEGAAREGGLLGELRWEVTRVPERYLRGEEGGGASLEELESYLSVPNYGLLVVGK